MLYSPVLIYPLQQLCMSELCIHETSSDGVALQAIRLYRVSSSMHFSIHFCCKRKHDLNLIAFYELIFHFTLEQPLSCVINRDYFMESACVRDFHTSWWSIWNRTSERSERVRFLIQNQRVWKSRTKRFPCCNLFISYILRFLLFIQL